MPVTCSTIASMMAAARKAPTAPMTPAIWNPKTAAASARIQPMILSRPSRCVVSQSTFTTHERSALSQYAKHASSLMVELGPCRSQVLPT